jgi:hypothetical protein
MHDPISGNCCLLPITWFCGEMCQSHQKKIISETCLLSSLSCSQIWLIPLVDDHHHKIEESPPLSAAEHQNVSSQQWSFKGTWLLPLTTD